MMSLSRWLTLVTLMLVSGDALGQSLAFVAPGESPSRAASRAVIRCHEILEGQEDIDVLSSSELRRALAGLPPVRAGGEEDSAEDPLADVRQLVAGSTGDRERQSLARLGERIGVDLLVTVRRVGEELELRAFNVERGAYYRGTLMVPAMAPPDPEEIGGFVTPRLAAVTQSGEAEPEEDQPRRRGRRRSRWWIWAIVGGAVAAAAVVGYLVAPGDVEDTGVTLHITAP